jgi:mannosyltransferase
MAAGLPAVTTRVGGNAEVNGHGITGLMVPASDVDVLTEAISLFIEHPEIALKMGERARSRIQERFSLDAMAASYDSLYSELLTNHPVPRQTITVES